MGLILPLTKTHPWLEVLTKELHTDHFNSQGTWRANAEDWNETFQEKTVLIKNLNVWPTSVDLLSAGQRVSLVNQENIAHLRAILFLNTCSNVKFKHDGSRKKCMSRSDFFPPSEAKAWKLTNLEGSCYVVNTEIGKLRPIGQIWLSTYFKR